MKTLKSNKRLLLIILAFLIAASCELEKVNINPNSPTEVPANVLLPFNQSRLARLMGSTPQVMAGIFMQYYQGVDNHPSQVQIYRVEEALYVDWDWNDYYDGPMINTKKMIEVAESQESWYYMGIGKIMMALCLGNLTSMWGDIPYSEALNGGAIRSPVFDSQEFIYEEIQRLLDDGISDLNQDYEGFKPGSDDIIFKGDISKWIMTAHALKARYYMHLSKQADELDFDLFNEVLTNIDQAFASGSDDMEYIFGFSSSEYNPFYSFSIPNYIIPNNSFTQKMSLLSDPRRKFFYTKEFGKSTLKGLYFTSSNSPVHMMTFHELKFIEAEARLRLNESDPLADTAFRDAVEASIIKIAGSTVDETTIVNYLNANTALTGTLDDKIEKLILQKYIAMFASIESWTDYRRTGFPVLIPNEGGDHNQNPGGAIPRRLTYPQTERLYNQNFPEYLPNLQDRVWWDD